MYKDIAEKKISLLNDRCLISFPLLYIQNVAQPLNTQISASVDNTMSNFM